MGIHHFLPNFRFKLSIILQHELMLGDIVDNLCYMISKQRKFYARYVKRLPSSFVYKLLVHIK